MLVIFSPQPLSARTRGLPARTWAADAHFDVLHAVFLRGDPGLFGGHLCREGVLLREPRKPQPPEVAQDRCCPAGR